MKVIVLALTLLLATGPAFAGVEVTGHKIKHTKCKKKDHPQHRRDKVGKNSGWVCFKSTGNFSERIYRADVCAKTEGGTTFCVSEGQLSTITVDGSSCAEVGFPKSRTPIVSVWVKNQ